ncbi:MAG: hypothetical protein H8E40_08735 [Chloroflexi bacterium]|nr:hypothetical protein [Chloroflexota bacterium]MBL7061888.1 hypothetical protein [Dehalococcoidia bacterium]
MNIRNNSCRLVVCVTIALVLVAVMLGGCGNKEGSTQGGVISEVTMAAAVDENDRPIQPTSVFTVDTEAFYCSLRLSHFPLGTGIRAEWVYMGDETAGGVAEKQVLRVNTATIEGDGYTSVSLQRPPYEGVKWPKGDYKVVLYVEGEETASVSFRVE